ncbi:TRAP transporter small permease [Tepidiphilus sp. J10]|uniref:TRAP transporter small permease n=1 Tax=Tepidiphilus sp. J10 TaxID=2502185 RepID=UPI00115E8924|nr:TRAP transporter small permease [Tepidiphilus sp. J10]
MFRRLLDRLEEFTIGALLAISTLVIFLAVVHRYLAGFAIPYLQDWLLGFHFGWAQEFAMICAVWMAKFGAAYGVRTGIHVGVDLLVMRLHGGARRACITLGLLCGLLFCGLLVWYGVRLVWENGAAYAWYTGLGRDPGPYFEGPLTADLEWPSWMVYLAIPLGSALMGWRFLEALLGYWRDGILPQHRVAHVKGLDEGEGVPPSIEQGASR